MSPNRWGSCVLPGSVCPQIAAIEECLGDAAADVGVPMAAHSSSPPLLLGLHPPSTSSSVCCGQFLSRLFAFCSFPARNVDVLGAALRRALPRRLLNGLARGVKVLSCCF